MPASVSITLRVNGVSTTVEAAPGTTLLSVLRDRLRLTGTKSACDRGECGACTVLVGGAPVMACVTLAALVGADVTTIEGISSEAEPLRSAFADEGAYQCGYCTPGQIVQATALLRAGLPESDNDLRRRMSGCVCRCTGYDSIIRALRRAVRNMSA